MAFFKVCPYCKANLDPGEECDCQEERAQERQKMQSMFSTGKGGQMQICFAQEVTQGAKVGV